MDVVLARKRGAVTELSTLRRGAVRGDLLCGLAMIGVLIRVIYRSNCIKITDKSCLLRDTL